ncbi:4'-phosphopantetheinyl transferase [Clostridium sp. DSM 8431]|uniref:4'-phosphopantetheinyl transferase family protein n=1 Tax=Clostridium sp. DSM 8431 TaxID=1761781 RepID=UPI0008EC4E3A|nr:4'-phosphopantetheinyl transferase superfamily protein [Clostridium sp. DSM 8431]SFU45573.1 4'-phosphopantetheinyl transferase [Clostridium sp. DSM 8431]
MEVCYIDISCINYEDYIDFLLSFVDENKKKKALRFIRKEDRIRTLIADIMVRSYVCEKYNYKNKDIIYGYNEFKKPYLINKDNINFNVSHSGKYVVAAFDNEAIGVDVEKINKDTEYKVLAKNFYTKNEYLRIENLNEEKSIIEFFKLWTFKESYIKFEGKGLSIPLNSFEIEKNNENNTYYLKDNEKNIYFNNFNIDEEYELSCCSRKKDAILKEITFNDLIYSMKKYL